ncbi:MAG: YihY/virulence factor BrkB family protein [Rhodothermales bacterium]
MTRARKQSRTAWSILKETVDEFMADDCLQMAAAVAFYTVFSLPPLLVLIVTFAGVQLGEEAVQGRLAAEITQVVGSDAAGQIQMMVSNASHSLAGGGSFWAMLIGVVALVAGATGAFHQLQRALNRAWGVQPAPDRSSIATFFVKRALSFGMILGTGFLLVVSLALSTTLTAIGSNLQELVPGLPLSLSKVMDFAVSVALITTLFAAMYRILPDARISWRDVWTGAGVTGALFVVGKMATGIYLGQSNPGSVFGAAGSFALVLLWIYYSAVLVLLGAEFTQVWARRHGEALRPSKGAVRVSREIQRP